MSGKPKNVFGPPNKRRLGGDAANAKEHSDHRQTGDNAGNISAPTYGKRRQPIATPKRKRRRKGNEKEKPRRRIRYSSVGNNTAGPKSKMKEGGAERTLPPNQRPAATTERINRKCQMGRYDITQGLIRGNAHNSTNNSPRVQKEDQHRTSQATK